MLRDGVLQRPTGYPMLQDGVLSRPTECLLQLRKYSHSRQSTSAICVNIVTADKVRNAIEWNTTTADKVQSTCAEILSRPKGYFFHLRKHRDGRQSISFDKKKNSNGRQSTRHYEIEYSNGRQNTQCYKMEYSHGRQKFVS